MKSKIWFGVFVIALSTCGKKAPFKKPKILNGLNGPAHYCFNNDNKVFLILKEEYQNHPVVNVSLTRDTVRGNEDFSAEIVVLRKDYKILLNDSTLFNGHLNDDGRWEFTYKPEKSGIYEFKGHIKYDSIVEPFEYKFIAIL